MTLIFVIVSLLFPWRGTVAESDFEEAIYNACGSLKTNDQFDKEKASNCIRAMINKLSDDQCKSDLGCAEIVKQKLSESTLTRVRKRGYLICGVSSDIRGFSKRPDKPEYVDAGEQYIDNLTGISTLYRGSNGLESDLCRIVAIAVFGSNYSRESTVFKDVDLTSRFKDLTSNAVDVVFRSSTWTSLRDTSLGVDFGPVYFHDGQKFMVETGGDIKEIDDLNDKPICVRDDTTTILNLESVFAQLELNLKLSENNANYKNNDDLLDGFTESECEAIAGDESALLSLKAFNIHADTYTILPDDPISYEPLAAMVAEHDHRWRDLVNYSVLATMWAEQEGISQKAPRSFAIETWKSLGLDENTGQMIIAKKGNYGELFERHLSAVISNGRGRNQPREQHEEGWMITPPMQPSTTEVVYEISAQFDTGSHILNEEIKKQIATFIQSLTQLLSNGKKIISIKIIGHTDSRGDPDENLKLSIDRANSVSEQFENEFPKKIIKPTGQGQTNPIESNKTEEGRQKNRRVVVEVVAK